MQEVESHRFYYTGHSGVASWEYKLECHMPRVLWLPIRGRNEEIGAAEETVVIPLSVLILILERI